VTETPWQRLPQPRGFPNRDHTYRNHNAIEDAFDSFDASADVGRDDAIADALICVDSRVLPFGFLPRRNTDSRRIALSSSVARTCHISMNAHRTLAKEFDR